MSNQLQAERAERTARNTQLRDMSIRQSTLLDIGKALERRTNTAVARLQQEVRMQSWMQANARRVAWLQSRPSSQACLCRWEARMLVSLEQIACLEAWLGVPGPTPLTANPGHMTAHALLALHAPAAMPQLRTK